MQLHHLKHHNFILNIINIVLCFVLMFSISNCKSVEKYPVKKFEGKILIEMNVLFNCYRENDYYLVSEQIIQKPKSKNSIINAYKKGLFIIRDDNYDDLSNLDYNIENKFSDFYDEESIKNFQKLLANELDMFYTKNFKDSTKYYWCKNLAYLEVNAKIHYVEYDNKIGFIPKLNKNVFKGYDKITLKRSKILKIEIIEGNE